LCIEPGKRCGNRDEVSLILANIAEEIGPLRGRGGLAPKDFLGFGVENVGGEGELLLSLMGFEDFDFKVGAIARVSESRKMKIRRSGVI